MGGEIEMGFQWEEEGGGGTAMDFQWDEELQRVFNEGLGWGRRRSPSIPPRSVNWLKQGVGGSEGLLTPGQGGREGAGRELKATVPERFGPNLCLRSRPCCQQAAG